MPYIHANITEVHSDHVCIDLEAPFDKAMPPNRGYPYKVGERVRIELGWKMYKSDPMRSKSSGRCKQESGA